ncbi:hypothetical protein M569_09400 [Genlisea aurea]|uniref:Uncharacterized protein n=1 Tax=Genlisea aurea TaxID=192259 RepID=S8DZE0_9LAMI|nr:hypothetical protein M569_09400 [Genlisea aurea]
MTRRCSHCSHNGHNSRTCPNRGVKLFGVRLTDVSIRKSASMGNLSHYAGGGSGNAIQQNGVAHDSPGDTPDHPSAGSGAPDGYASEDCVAGPSSTRERKKGRLVSLEPSSFFQNLPFQEAIQIFIAFANSLRVPWTEEEHRMFLQGLQKLGKGDWRGIARNYVISRTPTQVASHAQKYFIRQCNVSRRKRRSSLFDIVADESADAPVMSRDFFPLKGETQSGGTALEPVAMEEDCESMESANSNEAEPANPPAKESSSPSPSSQFPPFPIVYPAYVAAPVFQLPVPFWAAAAAEGFGTAGPESCGTGEKEEEAHEVVKPTAVVHSKNPINVDELVGMSKLSIGGGLSLKLSRPSAFHANNPPAGSASSSSSNSSSSSSRNPKIHAV